MLREKVSVLLLGAILGITAAPGQGQAGTGSPATFKTMDSALFSIGTSCGIHIGFAQGISPEPIPPIQLVISCSNVSETLNSLISQREGYMWSADNGIYDVYSSSEPNSIADLNIATYSVSNASLAQASDAVDHLPEVMKWLSQHRVRRYQLYTGRMWPSKRRASFALHNVPLRGVLNRIIREYRIPRWNVSFWGDRSQYLAIRFNN